METNSYLRKMNLLTKKVITISLLTILMIGNAVAQTEECVPIGTGSDEFLDYPFSTGLAHSYLQQIYTKEELSASEIKLGDKIKGIAFNYFWSSPTTRPIKIFIGNTSQTEFNGVWISSNKLKEVFSSNCQEFSKGTDNWSNISFSEAFEYLGENIVIAILMNKEDAENPVNCFTNANVNKRFYTHQTPNKRSIYKKIGQTNPITFNTDTGYPMTGSANLDGNASDRRSNIKFCKLPVSCPRVEAINATNISGNSITLDWTNGGSESSWTIEYGETGFTQGEGETINATNRPFSITDLDPITSYDFYIQAVCSDNDKSVWSNIKDIKTICGTINSTNYIEDFPDESPSLECWRIIDENNDGTSDGKGTWSFKDNTARYQYNSNNTASDWLISPKVKIKENMKLNFAYRVSNNSYPEKFSVWIIENSPDNYENGIEILPKKTVDNKEEFITIEDISLDNFTDQAVHIAIKCESDPDMSSLFIKNFRVFKPSSENKITSFKLPTETGPATIDDINNKVDIVVSFSTDKSALAPEIEVSELASISPVSGETRDFNSPQEYVVTAENGKTKTWTVEVKNAETGSPENDILDFKFPNQIGDSKINTESHTVEATIDWQQALTNIAPTIEISQFASISPASGTEVDFTNSPVTYTVKADNGNPQEWKVTIINDNPPIGANCENPEIIDLSNLPNIHNIFSESTQSLGNVFDSALGKNFNAEDKVYKLSVAQNSIYSIKLNTEVANVGIGIFKGCPTDNVLIDKSFNKDESNNITITDVALSANTDYYLLVDKKHDPYFIYLYNLRFSKNENPDCTSPNPIEVSDISQTSAKLNWHRAFNEKKWEIKYGPYGFDLLTSGTNINDISATTYQITGLSNNSNYSAYIRSVCNNNETGKWIGPINFTTIADCPTPTDLTITSINNNSAEIKWNGHNASNWILEYKLAHASSYESVNLTTSSHTLSDLKTTNTYIIRVKAKCPDSKESMYSEEKTYHTSCEEISEIPYFEDFENYGANTSDAFPLCWHRPSKDNSGLTIFPSIVTTAIDMPTKNIKFKSDPTTPTIVATPIFNIDIKDLVLEFRLKKEKKDSGKMLIGTMTNPNNKQSFKELTTIIPNDNTANEYIIYFSDYNFTSINTSIAFKHVSNSSDYYYWLDDVKVREKYNNKDIISFTTSDILAPGEINYSNHTITGIVSQNADLTQQTPVITISEFARISPESGAITDFSSPVTYTVSAENGSEETWTVTLTKATAASSENDILSFTFPEQVGTSEINYTSHTVKAKIDWTKQLTSISPSIEISNFASISPLGGIAQNFTTPVKYSITSEDGKTQIWTAIIEKLDSPIGADCDNPVVVELSTKSNPYSILNETTEGFGDVYNETSLNYHDNGPDKIYKLVVSQNSLYNIKMSTITNYAGIALFRGCPSENVTIKQAINGSNSKDLLLENIVLQPDKEYFLMVDNSTPNPNFLESYNLIFTKNENPPCTNPTDLNVSNVLQTTAIVSWSPALTETQWELKYGTQGFDITSNNGIDITENVNFPYTLSGLTENTKYSIYIRSKCSESEVYGWEGPVNFRTLESCPTPTDLSISSITSNSAQITWNGHNATNWALEYKLASATDFETIDLSTSTHTLSNLSSSSTYIIRVKAKCENGESNYSAERIFYTNCENISIFPYIEDFENYEVENSNAFPICWYRPVTNNESSTTFPSIVSSTADIPTRCLKFRSLNTTPTIAATPIFNTNIEDLVVEFTLRREEHGSGTIIVGVMSNPNDLNSFTNVYTINPENNNAKEYLIKFRDYPITGANKAIAFKHVSNENKSYYWLDNVKVRKQFTNNDILDFSTNDIILEANINNLKHEITGTISFDSEITQQIPTIVISEFATISPESGVVTDFSNPVKYTVTAENGSEETWTVTLTKATAASSENRILNFTFPDQVGNSEINYTEHTVNAKIDWKKPLTKITPNIKISNFATISPGSDIEQDFTNPFKYEIKAQNNNTQEWTVTIEKTVSPVGGDCDNAKILNLSSLTNPYSISDETTKGYGNIYSETDLENHDNGQDKIYKLLVTQNSVYDIKMHSISGKYAGIGLFKGCPSENFLMKKATNGIDSKDLVLENVVMNSNLEYFLMVDNYPTPDFLESYELTFKKIDNPPCTNPADLSSSEITTSSATFTWSQALEEPGWELKYGYTGFNPYGESGELISENVTSPYILNGLTANTNYSIYIRSKCSDTETSQWSSQVNFKTLESCPKPTDLKINTITNNSAEITWNGDNANKWIIEYKLLTSQQFESIEVNTNPYTLSSLEPSRTYQIRVKALCSDTDQSLYTEIKTFNTLCNIISSFPYIEEFTYNTGSTQCWTIIDANQDAEQSNYGKWAIINNQAKYSSNPTNNADDWLISPLLEISEDQFLSFDYKVNDSNYSEKFSVHIIKGDSPQDLTNTTEILPLKTVNNETYTTIASIFIDGTENQKFYIGIKCQSDANMDAVWIDNFKIQPTSSNNIISFTLPTQTGDANIDRNNHKVDIEVSSLTDLSILTPTITVTPGATISPESNTTQDFSNGPITYTVSSEDQSSQDWIVTVTKQIPTQYKITASAGENGKIDPAGEVPVDEGKSQSFTITPNPNYQIDEVLVNNIDKKSELVGNIYTFTNVQADHTIVAKFKESTTPPAQTFTITASVAGGNGTINPSGDVSVPDGENKRFNFIPNNGNILDKVLVDGNEITTPIVENSYTFTNVQADHTIVVSFKESTTPPAQTFTIKASVAGGNGSINPNGNVIVPAGENKSFYFIPANGYILDKVLVDGNEISIPAVGNSYTFTNVQANHTIVAKFTKTEAEQFTIIAAVFEGNGTINPTYKTVDKGSDVEFLITPHTNYKLDKLMNNGVDKTGDVDNNKYTLHNIKESHNIVVKFKLANNISEEYIVEINIYPNPTNDLLNIEVSDEISHIEIMSIDGKLLDRQNVNSNKYQYNTSSLAEGNYFVRIYTENKISIKQFSVKR